MFRWSIVLLLLSAFGLGCSATPPEPTNSTRKSNSEGMFGPQGQKEKD
jgi:hypothetical protein